MSTTAYTDQAADRDRLVQIAQDCFRSAHARDGLIPSPSVAEDFVDRFVDKFVAAGFVPAPLGVA